ncbi:hypothetical protein PIB30_042305 [Stylosanthes scabra]|uniref:Uncharacterized protein n=1 Tax=Stylosanthes scabra TaxID=79078 RepID=A0ABU6YCI3_9FABA|nr:hypothetical protein [Stylosanthes scabra]
MEDGWYLCSSRYVVSLFSLLRNGFGCEDSRNGCYNLFKNYCENFAIYCKTGLVAVTCKTIGQSGQIISYIAVPVAAIFRTPSLVFAANACGIAAALGMGVVTTALYAMAATATGFGAIGFIGAYCMKRYISDIGIRRDVEKVEVDELTRKLAEGLFRVGEP